MRRAWLLTLVSLTGCGAAAPPPAAPGDPDPVTIPAGEPSSEATGEPQPTPVEPTADTEPGSEPTAEGASCASAIVIEAANELEGVAAEYAWLRQRYPGYQTQQQSLIECNGRPADVLQIRTAEGQDLEVYFDISGFFGKF